MFRVIFEYECDICDKIVSYSYGYQNDRIELPKPKIPSDWCESASGYICDNHLFLIDNKTIQEINQQINNKPN